MPQNGSSAIDAGLNKLILDGITVIEIPSDLFSGSAPDLGAVESNDENTTVSDINFSENYHIRNYPNPFKGSTTISVNIPQTDYIKIDICDMLGRNVYKLEEGFREKGVHNIEWFANDAYGNPLPGGIYFARIRTGNIINNAKLLLLQ
jgi:flagellar hook assembly protein FlgD